MDKPKRNDIWYELRNGRWGSVKNDIGIARTDLIRLYFSMYGQMKVPNKWVFNDFGPIAIRWFKDVNGNGKLDESERLSGQMFHTTPDNEAQQALGQTVTLSSSHGCIHLKPADRDRLLSVGAFSPGAVFIVHKYHEKP